MHDCGNMLAMDVAAKSEARRVVFEEYHGGDSRFLYCAIAMATGVGRRMECRPTCSVGRVSGRRPDAGHGRDDGPTTAECLEEALSRTAGRCRCGGVALWGAEQGHGKSIGW